MELDAIDDQLRALLVQRFAVSVKIGAYKREHKLPIFDAAREQEIVARHKEMLSTMQEKEAIAAIWQTIMSESKRVQTTKKDVK